MDASRWQYLKSLQPSEGVLIWDSRRGPYRNQTANLRRRAKRSAGSARQFRKSIKALRRITALSQAQGRYDD
jgi:hypothetical protein